MRKFICLILATMMVLSLAACNESEPSKDTNSTNKEQQSVVGDNEQSDNEGEDTVQGEEDNLEGNTGESEESLNEYTKDKKIYKYDIYVSYKQSRLEEFGSYVHRFYGHGEDIVMFIFDEQVFDVPSGFFEYYNDGRIPKKAISATNASFNPSGEYIINVTTSKNTTVNKYDCYNFEGSVTDDNGRVCFAYGYTFQVGDVSCMLVGFVFTPEQTEEEIQSIIDEVDAMMQTVRTEK